MKKPKLLTHKKTAIAAAILLALGCANGATINVDGSCTLVDAIVAANSDTLVGSCTAGTGNDVIQITTENSEVKIFSVFQVSNALGNVGLPIITSNITIQGNGLTVVANNINGNFRLFEVSASGDLTLNDTTVSSANDGFGMGSGLLSLGGRVTLENTVFTLNNGAIFLNATSGNEISNTSIRHNFVREGNYSAGLTTYQAELSISNTDIVKNRYEELMEKGVVKELVSGGASLIQSTVSIKESTISVNVAPYGGGITISEQNLTSVKMKHSDKLFNRGNLASQVTLTNSTITENKSLQSAGIQDFTNLGSLTIQGSIISGNHEMREPLAPNIYSSPKIGTITLDANNIIGDNGSSGTLGVILGSSDFSFSNSTKDNLYTLSLTNGHLIHPLKISSSAIDANQATCFGSVQDQEGKDRSIDGDNNGSAVCDIGAFEHSLPIIVNDSTCTLTNAIVSANTDTSVAGCQTGNGHDIIALPENSNQLLTEPQFTETQYGLNFGLPNITSGITIAAQGSVIQRSETAKENFGIFHIGQNAQLSLINSIVSGASQEGSAILSRGGNMNIVDSRISHNSGGGLFDFYSINSSVINSTITENQAYLPSIQNDFGTGIASYGSTGFTLENSTINNNSGGIAGGVDVRGAGMSYIVNNTVSGNEGWIYGGMLLIPDLVGKTTLSGLTITNNLGDIGGFSIRNNSLDNPISLKNSIISGNLTLISGAPEPVPTEFELFVQGFGPTQINGSNILGQNNLAAIVGISLGATDLVPSGPTSSVIKTVLADNGGATLTHLPILGGIAIDTGDESCTLTFDQIGNKRPLDGDSNGDFKCDSGAVEYNPTLFSDIIFMDGFEALEK